MTAEMPPPSGLPQPAMPPPDATPTPVAPPSVAPPSVAPPPLMPSTGPGVPTYLAEWERPRSGLAVAALVCGLAGFIPPVAVVGVVLGIVALARFEPLRQKGRAMAVSGLVVGMAWLLLLGPAFMTELTKQDDAAPTVQLPVSDVQRDDSGQVSGATDVFATEVKFRDCFDGLKDGLVIKVTLRRCSEPHEAQAYAVSTVTGPFPGKEQALEVAVSKCADLLEGRVTTSRLENFDIYAFYPPSEARWKTKPTLICSLVPLDGGETTGDLM